MGHDPQDGKNPHLDRIAHFSDMCHIGTVLVANGIGPENWVAVGAGAFVPIHESTCVPPALLFDEATQLQNLFAAALFRTYRSGDTGYAANLTPPRDGCRRTNMVHRVMEAGG